MDGHGRRADRIGDLEFPHQGQFYTLRLPVHFQRDLLTGRFWRDLANAPVAAAPPDLNDVETPGRTFVCYGLAPF